MSLQIKNLVVIALLLLAVNFAFCAALVRARRHYAYFRVTSQIKLKTAGEIPCRLNYGWQSARLECHQASAFLNRGE
jgi:hypothetical protein